MAELVICTVYDSPKDLPGRFVARKWIMHRPTSVLVGAGVQRRSRVTGCRVYCSDKLQPKGQSEADLLSGHRPHRYQVEHGIAEGVASNGQAVRFEPTTTEA